MDLAKRAIEDTGYVSKSLDTGLGRDRCVSIAAGIVGVKAWLRLPTKVAPVGQYGYKVSLRDPGP